MRALALGHAVAASVAAAGKLDGHPTVVPRMITFPAIVVADGLRDEAVGIEFLNAEARAATIVIVSSWTIESTLHKRILDHSIPILCRESDSAEDSGRDVTFAELT